MLDDKTFGSQIDPARIGAAGHSAGGYTVIAVAGGITDPAQLQAFCRSPVADASCKPPPEISDMRQKSLARLSSDPDFRQRYSEAGICPPRGRWLLSRPEQGGRRDEPSHARPIHHRAWPTSVRHDNLDGLLDSVTINATKIREMTRAVTALKHVLARILPAQNAN